MEATKRLEQRPRGNGNVLQEELEAPLAVPVTLLNQLVRLVDRGLDVQ